MNQAQKRIAVQIALNDIYSLLAKMEAANPADSEVIAFTRSKIKANEENLSVEQCKLAFAAVCELPQAKPYL